MTPARARPRTIRGGPTLIVLLAAVVGGCALDAPGSPSDSPVPTSVPAASSTAVPPSVTPSRIATLASPGTPYTAEELLAAMLDSRRPGGVPDALETEAIAAAIAELLWTWDGQPWAALAVSGACGPDACSLDVAGAASNAAAGDDLYTFSVDPGSGVVELVTSDLHGYPLALDAELDAAARATLDPSDLDGLSLVGARWLPPPETDRYWLAYRSGGEEGAPRVDVLLDLRSGEVLQVENDA